MNSLVEILKTRRSIRKYLPKAVEPEKIHQIITAALMSPASKRSNPWEFIVVEDKEMLQKLSECRPHSSGFLADAALGIVVIADTTKSDIWIEDASIAAIIMQLQAHDAGLGSCWIQVYKRMKNDRLSTEDYIRELLSIPAHFAVINIISIGYPNEEKRPVDESKLDFDKIHYDSY